MHASTRAASHARTPVATTAAVHHHKHASGKTRTRSAERVARPVTSGLSEPEKQTLFEAFVAWERERHLREITASAELPPAPMDRPPPTATDNIPTMVVYPPHGHAAP